MPKHVDHDERRREIIRTVWRLIATEGLERVTTRRIAEVTGYANGALRYYFPGKDSVIVAAFHYVFEATNDRAHGSLSLRGLPALRALAVEILPLDDDRLDEARVVVNFWQRALHSADEAQIYTDRMSEWRSQFIGHLEQAQADGTVPPAADLSSIVDELLSMLMGAQILGLFSPNDASPDRQLAQLDGFISRIATDPAAHRG